MIAVLERGCSVKVKADIVRFIEGAGFRAQVSEAEGENFIGVVGAGAEALAERLGAMPGVREVHPAAAPYPLVMRRVAAVAVAGLLSLTVVVGASSAVRPRPRVTVIGDSVLTAVLWVKWSTARRDAARLQKELTRVYKEAEDLRLQAALAQERIGKLEREIRALNAERDRQARSADDKPPARGARPPARR